VPARGGSVPVTVSENASIPAISTAERDVNEQERRIDAWSSLVSYPHRCHQAAVIEADHQWLGSFGDELGAIKPRSARWRAS